MAPIKGPSLCRAGDRDATIQRRMRFESPCALQRGTLRTNSSAVHLLLARELDGECLLFAFVRRGALTAWAPDDWSFRTTLSSDLLTLMRPLYSMKPSLRKRFMKKLTRDRVVPIISASVSCDILGIIGSGSPGLPNSAIRRRILASRFSLELNS